MTAKTYRRAPVRVRGAVQKESPGGVGTEPDDHGLGRSRGGLTTKLHLAVEQGQKPLAVTVTAGHRHDSPQFQPVLDAIRVPRQGAGRPRTRPNKVRADKAYGSRANRAYLRRRGVQCTIPEKADHVCNRKKLGSRGGRPPMSDKDDYDFDARGGEFTVDPPIPPGTVLAGKAQDQGADRADGGRSSTSLRDAGRGMAPFRQAAVPAQDRGGAYQDEELVSQGEPR
jgi:hypothetical protein